MRQQPELESGEISLDENPTFTGDEVPTKRFRQALQSWICANDAAGGSTGLPSSGIATILTSDALKKSDHPMQLAPDQQFADQGTPGPNTNFHGGKRHNEA